MFHSLQNPHESLRNRFNIIKARVLGNTSFSFVTREPSLELSSSDASVFGTQWSEDGNEDELVVSDRKERRKWSPTEDLVLISAWLKTSKDHVVGNE